jgi:hypothetical protein
VVNFTLLPLFPIGKELTVPTGDEAVEQTKHLAPIGNGTQAVQPVARFCTD